MRVNDSEDTHHPGYPAASWELCTLRTTAKGDKVTLAFPASFSCRFWLVSHYQDKQVQIYFLGIFEARGVRIVLSPKLLCTKAVLNPAGESPSKSFSLTEYSV